MATINFATREITAKVVYFGAEGSGCNTNIEHLHTAIPGRSKSALHRFGPPDIDERSEYFDYVSSEPAHLESFAMAYRIYSLPGAITLAAHREELMRNVDAVVLVADARETRNRANVDALLELESLLTALGHEMSSLVVVIQVNHSDADDARPTADVIFDLNPFGFPVVTAAARAGVGVSETLQEVSTGIGLRVKNSIIGQTPSLPVKAVHIAERETDAEVIQKLVHAIREASAVVTIEQISEDSPPDALPIQEGPEVEIAFQPREMLGSHPVRVLQADIEDDRVRVDILMEHMSGGDPTRVTVWLINRPTDTSPVVRSPPPQPAVIPTDRVLDYLPDPNDPSEEGAASWLTGQSGDISPLWFGVFGVSSGILIGLLSGYLVGIL